MRRGVNRAFAITFLASVVTEVCDFFNVGKNMNAMQVAMTAELILDGEQFGDLSLGNIKACFRNRMMKAELYDRLDGQIILRWLIDFSEEMVGYVICARDREHEEEKSEPGIAYDKFVAELRSRAEKGDAEAVEALRQHELWMSRTRNMLTPEQRREKDLGYFKFKHNYLKEKRNE